MADAKYVQNNDRGKSKSQLLEELEHLRREIKTLREHEGHRRFRDLAEDSRQAHFIQDNLHILSANRAAAEMFGYDSVEEILALDSALELILPEDHDRIRQINSDQHEGRGILGRNELQGVRKDGTEFWFEMLSRLVKWEGKTAVQSTLIDLAERKVGEETLHQSNREVERRVKERTRDLEEEISDLRKVEGERKRVEANFHNLVEALESISEGFALFDENDRLVHSNSKMSQLFGSVASILKPGVSFSEIIRAQIETYPPPHSIGREEDYMAERMEQHLNPKIPIEQEFDNGEIFQLREYPTDSGGIVCIRTDITELKQREFALTENSRRLAKEIFGRTEIQEKLKKNREHLTQFINFAPTFLLYIDRDLRYCQINSRYLDYLSWKEEEVIGRYVVEVIGQKTFDLYRPVIETVLGGQESSIEVLRPITNKGMRRLEEHYVPDLDDSGEVVGFYVSVQDITDRKDAEKALRESEEKYRNLVEGSVQGLIIHTEELLFANQAAVTLFGYDDPKDMMSLEDISALFAPEEHEVLLKKRRARLKGENIQNQYECKGVRKDGTNLWLETHVRVVNWEGQSAIQCTYSDITKRKEAEEAQRESEARMRLLTDAVPVQIAYVDSHGYYRFSSATHARWLASTPEELVGKHFQAVQSPEVVEFIKPYMVRAFAGKTQNFEMQRTYPDGKERMVQTRYIPDIGPNGAVHGYSAMVEDITERRKTEDVLRNNEIRLQNFIDSSPSNLAYLDRDLNYRQVNARYLAFVGKTEEEVIGHTATEVLGEEAFTLYQPWIEEALGGQEQRFEVSRSLRDLGVRDLEVRYVPDIGPQGHVVGFHASAEDITERKQAERVLRDNESRLQRFIDSAPSNLAYMSRHYTIDQVNARYLEFMGMSEEEVVGHHAAKVIGEEAFEYYKPWIDKVLTGIEQHFEVSRPHRELGIRDLEIRYVPNFDAQGQVLGFYLASEDITKRKQAERVLKDNESRLQNFINSSPSNLCYVDRDLIYRQVNARFLAFIGKSEKEVVGHSISEVIGEKGFVVYQPWIEEVLQGREQHFEIARTLGDQGLRDLEVRYVPHFDLQGHVQGFHSAVQDITERKEAEEALKESRDQLRLVTDNLPALITYVDTNLRYQFVNKTAEAWYALPAEKILDRTIPEVLDSEFFEKIHPNIERALAGETTVYDSEATYPDGHTRTVQTSFIPDFGSNNTVRGYFALVVDITERKEAENALMESRDQLRLVTDNLPALVVYIDADYKFRFANKIARTWYGRSNEQILGRSVQDLFNESDYARLYPKIAAGLRGENVTFDEELTYPDGVNRSVHGSYVPHLGADGSVRGIYTLMQDITERKVAENALRERESLTRLLTDSVPMLVAYVDHESRYRYVNASSEDWFQRPLDEILGKKISDIIPAEEYQDIRNYESQVLAGIRVEYVRESKNMYGHTRIVRGIYVPDIDDAGAVRGFSVMAEDITERKRAEEEVLAQKRLLETVFNSIPHHLYVKDRNSRYQMINEPLAEFFGESAENIVGVDTVDIPSRGKKEGRDSLLEDQQLFDGVVSEINVENTHRMPHGEICHLQVIKNPLRDERGNIVGLVGMNIDITERKRAEQALRESEERFKAIFDNTPSSISLKDNEGRYLLVNQQFQDWTGIQVEDVIGKVAHDVHTREHADHLVWEDLEVIQSGKVAVREFSTGSEEKSHRINTKFPVRDGSGQIVGVGTISTDITERKRAEEALRESEERFRAFFDNAPTLIHLKDTEGHFLLVNERHNEWYGIPPSAMIGKTSHDIHTKEAADLFAAQDQEVLRTGKFVQKEFTLREENPITIINTKFPVRDGDGKIVGVGTISSDVTGQRILESQLLESQKMEAIGQLAGGIAHDFNNLLQVVDGYANIALEQIHESEKLPVYLQKIISAGEKAANLTRQLLTFSRKTVLKRTSVNFNALIFDLIKLVGRVIEENIEIQLDEGIGLHPVMLDRGMMEQVVLNLCVNARDAMPEGGVIRIATENRFLDRTLCDQNGWEHEGDYILFSVKDEGMGISPQDLQHIFEPFFTTKEVGKGTGLGLSMVHSIVTQHQGMIQVESEPDVGTTFHIYLPASIFEPEQSETPLEPTPGKGHETILIAEDEDEVRILLAELLKSKGYQVLTASDGPMAVDLFTEKNESIDLVILDVIMPGLKGPQVHEAIRRIRPDIPVVFSTGYSDDMNGSDGPGVQNVPLIHKPYAPKKLFRLIRNLLDGKAEGESH